MEIPVRSDAVSASMIKIKESLSGLASILASPSSSNKEQEAKYLSVFNAYDDAVKASSKEGAKLSALDSGAKVNICK